MNKPKYLKAWLIFFLTGTIGGYIVGAVIGAIAGIILTIINDGDSSIVTNNTFSFQVGGFLIGIPISFFLYKWSVSKYILNQLEVPDSEHEIEN